jgi:hypothetical protein
MTRDSVNRQFGLVMFDDDREPSSGWAAVNGGQARRIAGPHELATDVIWWSNVSYEYFFKKTEIGRVSWLRHDKYLVITPKDVLVEWGYDPKIVGADFVCSFCSSMFHRVMTMAFRLLSDVDPKLRMDTAFVGKTLRDDVRRLVPELDYPKGEAAQVMKTGSAWQEFTRTQIRGGKGARLVKLIRPRLAYAIEMLKTPVPKAPFEWLSRLDLRSKNSDRTKWVMLTDQPCMAEVAITTIDPDIAPLYAFGSAIDQDKKTARNWVAHPELIVLGGFAEIDVKSAWVGSEYYELAPLLPECVKDFLDDKFCDLSWSAGIVAETIWRAAGLPQEKGKGFAAPGEDKAHASWQGAWLKSADKTAMFLLSKRLTDLGYTVVSYGIGWVMVSVQNEAVADLVKDSLTIGLLPSQGDVPEGLFPKNKRIPWPQGDNQSGMYAHFLATRQTTLLWNLDKLPLLDKDRREVMLQKLIEQSRGR